MFKNYLKVAARNLLKHKAYSFINIFGLAVGMACCGVILLYIQKELSYDNYHQDSGQLYRVAIWKDATGNKQGQASASYELAEVLRKEYPEVLAAARLYRSTQTPVVKIDDRQFPEERFYFADSTIFDLFSLPLLKGESATALTQPNSIVVSRAIAEKYFRRFEVVGEVITVNLNNRDIDFKITGVVANAPENTHFKYDLLASFQNVEQTSSFANLLKSWYFYAFWTYVKLPADYPAAAFAAKLAQLVKKYFPPTRQNSQLFLQPVTAIHLTSQLEGEIEGNNNIIYIYIFAAIALLVLFIACINFMNLTTARSLQRAKEVGMRKVLGAFRWQLVKQFLAEAMLVSGLAIVLSMGLIELFLAIFNQLSAIQLSPHLFARGFWVMGFITLGLLVGLLSGIYPAFFLSAFQPSKTLKGVFAKTAGAGLRQGLVVLQMAVTIVLLIAIGTISQQLQFIRNKNLGFQKEFSFLDDQLNQAYRFESQLGKIVGYFTALAIFIACSGLFGMASFAAEQRTKEIGIRKVLGASAAGVFALLSRDFTRLVLFGFVIAAPLAYFGMNRWLDDFAYRISLGPGVFILAGIAAFVIAWVTVSYQSFKAALANPVEAMRYE